MEEKLLKLTDEVAVAIKTAVESDEYQSVIKAAKEKDTGTFEVVISTEHVDRMQEVIKQDGWQLDRYLANPIVLWGHDYRQLPIGVATELTVTEFEGKPALKARGKFADHEFAQTIRKMYDSKVIRSTSVGFIPKKFDEEDMNVITVAELLEFSFVSVPANPYALSTLSKQFTQAQIGDLLVKGVLNTNVKDAVDDAVDEVPVDVEETPEAPVEETPAVEETPEQEVETQIEEKKAELAALEEKIAHFKALDVTTIKSIILALEALIPAVKQEAEPESIEEEESDDPVDDQTPDGKQVDTAIAFLSLRKNVQTIASLAGEALRDARKEAEKHYK